MFISYFSAGLILASLALPAVAQEREWILDAADEDVYLLFGVPNTTDVGVSFWCKITSGEISIFAPRPAQTVPEPTVTIAIDNISHSLAATPSEDLNSKTVEARLLPQDKILEELQNAERFTLVLGAHKAVYPLNGADFSGLLKLCEAQNKN